jgi:hypothetical protein
MAKTHYQFKQTIKVNGAPFTNGQVVPKDAIHVGNALAMLSLGQLEECDAPPPDPVVVVVAPIAEPKPEPKPAMKPDKK